MKTGAQLITEERQRQIDAEGWTANHDDREHQSGDLAQAATCYAEAAIVQAQTRDDWPSLEDTPDDWPWDYQWWKPSKDPVRNLVKAGALIAAEIDRLQRLSNTQGSQPGGPAQSAGGR